MSELHVKKLSDVAKQYTVDEKTLIRLDKSCDSAAQELLSAYDIQFKYNTHFFDSKGYRLDIDTLIKRTNVITLKSASVSIDSRPYCVALLQKRFDDCDDYLRRTKTQSELDNVFLYNVLDNCDINDSVIFNRLKDIWGKIGLIDIRTKENICYSYCRMLGFNLVTDLALRYFTCIYSDVSSWGKTAITNILLEHTAGKTCTMSGAQTVNQFTFSNVAGSDFLLVDDFPYNLQSQLATELNNIVSNRRTLSEKKGKDAIDYNGVYIRPILSQNVRFRPSNDTTNLVDQKMLEIETNKRKPLNEAEKNMVSGLYTDLANPNIITQHDYDIFFNVCVKLYLDDANSFITTHTLAGNDLEYYKTCLEDVIDIRKLYANGYKKLSDICIKPETFFDQEEKKNKRVSYFYICRRLSKTYSTDSTTLRASDIAFSSKTYAPSECKNYILTTELLNEIRQYMPQPNAADVFNDTAPAHTKTEDYDNGIPF